MSKHSVFISYRRDDTSGHVGRLYDNLVAHFSSEQVFMDVDQIEPGEDFVRVIEEAVGACSVLLAVIGRHWLNSSGEKGFRLNNPRDFVRLEIAAALTRNIRVIPVLVNGAKMPKEEELPADLTQLTRRHAMELGDGYHWKADVDHLIKVIEKTFSACQQREEEARRRAAEEAKAKSEERAQEQRLAVEEAQKGLARETLKRSALEFRKKSEDEVSRKQVGTNSGKESPTQKQQSNFSQRVRRMLGTNSRKESPTREQQSIYFQRVRRIILATVCVLIVATAGMFAYRFGERLMKRVSSSNENGATPGDSKQAANVGDESGQVTPSSPTPTDANSIAGTNSNLTSVKKQDPGATPSPISPSGTNMNSGSSKEPVQKRITSIWTATTAEGSRVHIASDSPLSDYEGYTRGGRFYLKIPLADLPTTRGSLLGRGFDDVQVQRYGDGIIISFHLQSGTTARVEQAANRLEIVFTTPGGSRSSANGARDETRARRIADNAAPGLTKAPVKQ